MEAAIQAPLSGLKILDFTRVLSGPYCSALFGDVGANIIKIESPEGDDYRHIGPFVDGQSVLFEAVNRGKRSLVLDLKRADDAAVAKRLAREADVVLENFRPGVMAKLGLDWASLSAENPRLVYVSISGFGQTGPNVPLPAYDIIVQAMSGLMHATGPAEGSPTMVGEAIADVAGGLFAAWGTSVALLERERTGRGRHVDVALMDSLMAMTPTLASRHLLKGENPERSGNKHALSAPFGVYPARDGHFAVAVLNEKLFARFAEVIESPDLVSDTRFAGDAKRRENEPALAAYIENWSRTRSTDEVVAALHAAGIPASPLNSIAEAWQSTQAKQRGLASEVDAGHEARWVPEQPVHFVGAARGRRRAAPRLNQDKADIEQFGWGDDHV